MRKIRTFIIEQLINLIFSLLRKLGNQRKKTGDLNMPGIKETKEALLFGISMAMAIDETTQDGFQWTDVLSLIKPMVKLPAAIAGIQNVPAELADLDEAERTELVEAIKELEFASEFSEEIAEQALRVGVEIGNLILKIREAKN